MNHLIDKKKWADPEWHLKNRVYIQEFIRLSGKTVNNINKSSESSQYLSITPHFASLIDPNNTDDPVLRQIVPVINNEGTGDCFSEKIEKSVLPGVIRRYHDRIIVTPTNRCACYCAYCTRKWNWDTGQVFDESYSSQLKDYLNKNREIREVIITGGEPLLLSVSKIEKLLFFFKGIKTIESIRIGTRALTFLPQLFTADMIKVLKKYRPLSIMTHFNHPSEIVKETLNAIDLIRLSGNQLYNQSVLLKGVNDDAGVLKKLFYRLQSAGIKPYYLFNCDLVPNADEYRVDIRDALNIMNSLRSELGGLSLPELIVDHPEAGKTIITDGSIVEEGSKLFVKKNGKLYEYAS